MLPWPCSTELLCNLSREAIGLAGVRAAEAVALSFGRGGVVSEELALLFYAGAPLWAGRRGWKRA